MRLTLPLLLLAGLCAPAMASEPDHANCERAISLKAASHFEGVDAEYVYLRQHYPDHKLIS